MVYPTPEPVAVGAMDPANPSLELPRACPLCGATGAAVMFTGRDTVYETPGQWEVVRCAFCTLLFTHPAAPIDGVRRHYPSSYSAHAAAGAHRRRRLRDPWDRVTPFGGGRLLDVGCGSGGYLARMRDRGWRCVGVEPSPAAVAAARSAGLEVVQGVLPGANVTGPFEVAVMLGVIGCLPDPLATLRAVRELLAPGGRLIVSEHNAASAASLRFGPYWQGWDLPRHYTHLTPETMTALLDRAGFHRVRLSWRRRSSRWRHSANALLRTRRGSRLTEWIARSRLIASWMSALHGRGPRADEIVAEADR
ncbi:MAG: hypothetical protein DCC66_03610 [Planctomycetota bacterium]|nr:MAG: hypothetical protein DCC66_03610 [Planctomycetota bacterium]